MEKSANYFFVGIFVSLALLALVGFTIWLMGPGDFARYERYTVYFTDPVSGLVEEGVVNYKGVEVGRILGLRLVPERSDLVKVDIEVKEGTPVRAGTTAGIEIQGITGTSSLELTTESTDQKPPVRVAGEEYPVLQGKGSQLRALLDQLPKVAMQLETTLAAVDELSKEGAKTATSVRNFSENVNKKLDTTLSAFDGFSKEGAKTAGSLRELSENVNKKLDTTLSAVGDFTKEGAKTANSLRDLSDNMKKRLETTLSSIDDFTKEGGKTAGSIRGLADKLKDDPSQILRPPSSQRGVVIPK